MRTVELIISNFLISPSVEGIGLLPRPLHKTIGFRQNTSGKLTWPTVTIIYLRLCCFGEGIGANW